MIFIIRKNGIWEKWNVFLKSQRGFISMKQDPISSVDFRRIKSVYCFFKSDAIYCPMRRKGEILIIFLLMKKITKKIERDFASQKKERKKEKLISIVIVETASPKQG